MNGETYVGSLFRISLAMDDTRLRTGTNGDGRGHLEKAPVNDLDSRIVSGHRVEVRLLAARNARVGRHSSYLGRKVLNQRDFVFGAQYCAQHRAEV